MKVPINADENFLNQIFGLFAVTDGAIDEIQKTSLVTGHEFREGTLFTTKESADDS